MESLKGGHCPECGQVYITQESWEKYQAEHPPNPERVAEQHKKDKELLRNIKMRGPIFPISEEEWQKIVRAIEAQRERTRLQADANKENAPGLYKLLRGESVGYDIVLGYLAWWERERLEEDDQ